MTCTRRVGAVWTSCACTDCGPVTRRNAKLYRSGYLPVVDERAKAHARFVKWQTRGYSSRAVADMTGISERTVQAMFQRRTDPARMLHGTARAILAAPDEPTERGWVRSIGTVRRLRALTVMGWSMDELAKRCDLDGSTLAALRNDRHATTRPRFAAVVTALYDDLWRIEGPARLAAARARNRGWAPPLAWDDDTIDDPAAEPDFGAKTERAHSGSGRPSHVLVEDLAFLLEHDAALTTAGAAQRLGLTPESLKRALERAGRKDLRDQLTRNAHEAAA